MSQGQSCWLHSSFSPSVLSPLSLSLFFFFYFLFFWTPSPPSPLSSLCLWSVKYNYPITSHHLSTDWSIALTLDVREKVWKPLRRGTAATWLTVWEQTQGYLKKSPKSESSNWKNTRDHLKERNVKTHFLKSLPDSDSSTSIHRYQPSRWSRGNDSKMKWGIKLSLQKKYRTASTPWYQLQPQTQRNDNKKKRGIELSLQKKK